MYAGTKYKSRHALWDKLSTLMGKDIPSLTINDFNYIDGSDEKKGVLSALMDKMRRKEY